MLRLIIATVPAVLLALGGCASLSKSQCLASDWQTIGYRDGVGGVSSTALLRHQNACVKHGIIPDREAYLAGWNEGVRQFCQPANGFSAGEHGAGFSNVCPPDMQNDFHSAYEEGRRLYVARSEIADLEHGIEEREQRLHDVKATLAGIAAGLLDSDSTTADRAQMLINAKDLAEEQGKLQSEIEDLKAQVAVKTQQLEQLQQSLASSG